MKEHIVDTVCLWGAMGLLWYAFVSMIGEHFPEFLQITVLNSKSDKIATSIVTETNFENIGMDWWIIGLFVLVLWISYDWPMQYLKKIVIPCRVVSIVIPVAYVLLNFERILDGFYQLAEIYLPFINDYYKTRFFLSPENSGENSIIAFTALSMLFWWIVWMIAYGWKKRVVLALFPTFALGIELAVGLSPQGNGLAIWFVAAMLLLGIGGINIVKKILLLVVAIGSLFLSQWWFKEDIGDLATKEQKNRLLEWQSELNFSNLNIMGFLKWDMHFDWEPLSNNSPQYTGDVMLEIEADKAPETMLYLRGFYGTHYEDEKWVYDDTKFKEACKNAGKSQEEVAQALLQMPYERLVDYYQDDTYGDEEYIENHSIHYKIKHIGSTGDVAYTTYASDVSSFDEEYTFLGDYLMKKSIWDEVVEMNALSNGWNLTSWKFVTPLIDRGTFGASGYESDLFAYYGGYIDLQSQLAELEWMNDLADAYLEVPEDMDFLANASKEAVNYLPKYEFLYGGIDVHQLKNDNYRRMQYAQQVIYYLANQMAYSLRLDDIPYGEDPIEYALFESHEGYCMHFASAATLLLREADVPARYVSGYAVRPTAFVYDEEAKCYKAEVSDYMAHAWVEIYLDYIGWIPVEVTPGTSLASLPTEEDIERWENNSNHRKDYLENGVVETEDSQMPVEDSQTEETTEVPSESETTVDEKDKVDSEEEIVVDWTVLKRIGMAGIAIAVCVAIAMLTKKWILHYHTILWKEMKKNLTRKAVKRMNRRVYRILRIRNPKYWLMGRLTDVAYAQALKSDFIEVSSEDWDRYMEIVKKNYYSKEDVSIEEMQYVYRCYKEVKVFNKKLTKLWHNQG